MKRYELDLMQAGLPMRKMPQDTGRQKRREWCRGFSLIELLITIAIVVTLAAIAMPVVGNYVDQARTAKVVSDIRTTLEAGISLYEVAEGQLPDTLADVERGNILDPWGNTYEYLNFAAAGPSWLGKARKDRFLVPLNSDYDLYSKGKDGKSRPPLTAQMSWDDIIRANDGGYVGPASDY